MIKSCAILKIFFLLNFTSKSNNLATIIFLKNQVSAYVGLDARIIRALEKNLCVLAFVLPSLKFLERMIVKALLVSAVKTRGFTKLRNIKV